MRRTRDTEYSSTTRDFYPSNSSKPYLGHAPSSSEGFTNRLLSSNRGNQPSERLAPSIATAIYDQSSQNLKPKYLQPTVHPYSEKTQTAGAWRSGSKDRPLMGADQFIRTATESVRSGWEYPAQSNQKFVAAQYAEPVHRLPLGHAHYTPNETYGSQWQTHHHSNQAGPQVIYDTCDRDRGLPRSVSYENLRRTADAISGFADLRVEPAPHPALQEPLYTPGYLGPCFFDYKHTLARHPSMLDCVEDRTNANRMSQDLKHLDCLKKDDIGSSLRYPYTSAYLDMVGGDRPLNPSLGSVWNEFYPNRRDYWDLMHDSPEIHHRLDPTYLRNHYSNSSYYPYVHKDKDFRPAYPESFSKTPPAFPRDPHNLSGSNNYEQWLGEVKKMYTAGDVPRTNTNIGLANDRSVSIAERMLNSPSMYLSPGKLYDNPDYRNLTKRNIDMALRLGKLPPGEGISPAEELIYVLGEIIRLEAEWRTSRDIYLNRHDFEQQEIAKFVGEKRELNDDDLFRIFKQFGVHPSTQEISLFLKRFGNGTSVKAYDLLNLLIPQDYKPSFRNISERISPDTLELMGRCFRTLFKNELSRKSILTRVVERRLDVHQAWQQFETSQVTVDKLRDVLLRQNVLATTNDIQNLINLISKKEGGIMEEEDLRQFVGA